MTKEKILELVSRAREGFDNNSISKEWYDYMMEYYYRKLGEIKNEIQQPI